MLVWKMTRVFVNNDYADVYYTAGRRFYYRKTILTEQKTCTQRQKNHVLKGWVL